MLQHAAGAAGAHHTMSCALHTAARHSNTRAAPYHPACGPLRAYWRGRTRDIDAMTGSKWEPDMAAKEFCNHVLTSSTDALESRFSAARHSAAASSKRHLAQVAELVDAPGSGPGGGNTVEVRVLSWAPRFMKKASFLAGFFHFCRLGSFRLASGCARIEVVLKSIRLRPGKSTPCSAGLLFFVSATRPSLSRFRLRERRSSAM